MANSSSFPSRFLSLLGLAETTKEGVSIESKLHIYTQDMSNIGLLVALIIKRSTYIYPFNDKDSLRNLNRLEC